MHHQPELRLAQSQTHFKKQLGRLSLLLLFLSVVGQYGQVLYPHKLIAKKRDWKKTGGMEAWGDLQPTWCNMQSATGVASGLSDTPID